MYVQSLPLLPFLDHFISAKHELYLDNEFKEVTDFSFLVIGYVSPNLVSIDGKDTPEVYQTLMLPWMLQSPMFPKIALLMASLAQTLEMGRQAANGAEPYVLKAKVLNMMNSAVGGGQHDKVDIWRCIIHLVVTEVS